MGHLKIVMISAYLDHSNRERDHQGLGNDLIGGRATIGTGPIEYRELLGGLLKSYKRAA